MRILHVTAINSTGGGVGKYILSLSKELKEKNDVDSVITSLKECEFSSFVRSEGFKSVIIPEEHIKFFGKKFFFYLSLSRLIRLIKEEKIDIIHAHNPHPAFLCSIAARISGIPSVFTLHGVGRRDKQKTDLSGKISDIIFDLIEAIIGFFTGILVSRIIMVSTGTKKISEHLVVNKKKIVVIHNGIDMRLYESKNLSGVIKKNLNIDGSYVIGSVGRLDEDKGYAYLIESLAKFKESIPNVRLVLVGNGEEKENLRILSERLNISDRVIFAGFYKDIAAIIDTFDVFVLPSLCEGFGYSIIEAMAMKKSVVATKVEGITDIIENGKNGLLVPPKDPEAIYLAVLRLHQDGMLREKFESAGFSLVRDKFRLSIAVSKVMDIYKELAPEFSKRIPRRKTTEREKA